MTDAVDSTATEVGTDLEVTDRPPTTLFHTDDPVEVIERASRAADALKSILVRQRLTQRIGAKEHVLVEGWQTLGSMLGVVPVCVWTKPLDDGWEARVEARLLDGRVVGAAEAQCTRSEGHWKNRDDHSLRSMAQTRATSKALRGPLGFVITLAGYSATPAEEMPSEAPAEPRVALCTPEQYRAILAAYSAAGNPWELFKVKLDELGAKASDTAGERVQSLSESQAAVLLAWLEEAKS